MNQILELPWEQILLGLMGLLAIFISLVKTTASEKLKATGVKTEGIIFELDSSRLTYNENGVKDKITVRFTTTDKQWITETLKADFSIAYTGQYKVGEKVTVIYEEDNPSNFILETKQSFFIARLLSFFVGLVLLMISIYLLALK